EIRQARIELRRADARRHCELEAKCRNAGGKNLVKQLTHLDAHGDASMVDVSHKPVLLREAVAAGEIRLQRATLGLIRANQIAKGNVLATARIAGIQAAKRT